MQDWQVGRDLDPAVLRVVSDGVFQHGRALALAAGGDAATLACIVREDGVVIAGASGRTEFARLFVEHLWVEAGRRGQGLGTQVLAALEAAAREAGCHDALIETLDARAARLYGRLGYVTLAVVPGYVGPFDRHILRKRLSGPVRAA